MCKQQNIVAVSALVVLIVSLFLTLSSSIGIAYYHISGTVPAPMCNEYKTDSGTENNQELAIIITGGQPSSNYKSVEVIEDVSQNSSCSLPQLPDDRKYHTQTGPTLCGGYDSDDIKSSCVTFKGGSWTTSHTLVHQRSFHTAWNSPRGIILFGGIVSPDTAELLNKDGGSQEIFKLKHNSGYSCAIEGPDYVLITGGDSSKSMVSQYNVQGWTKDLPQLQQGRYQHACGHFTNDNNDMVFMVTGGYTGSKMTASTEALISGKNAWSYVGELPTAYRGMKSVQYKNTVMITGGYDNNASVKSIGSILVYNTNSSKWEEVGEMKESRNFHAISTIPVKDILDYC